MNLYTPVDLPSDLPHLRYGEKTLLMGSCFAQNMGERLCNLKFDCDVNPFGVLYNPCSLLRALSDIISNRVYTDADLQYHDGCWHSMMHHSSFSSPDKKEVLCNINNRLRKTAARMSEISLLMLTFGSAWVYKDKVSGDVVGNCHKLPERTFNRVKLDVDEIVSDYKVLFDSFEVINPSLKVLFTVSPIRHLRDGLHENQLSKSTLLLAVEKLCMLYPDKAFYFPSYEILIDELRDYRFYADDLAHPSSLAQEYVWERFACACMDKDTLSLLENVKKIQKQIGHKPINPDSKEYASFLNKIVLNIKTLSDKYPFFDFDKELEECQTRLNISQKL